MAPPYKSRWFLGLVATLLVGLALVNTRLVRSSLLLNVVLVGIFIAVQVVSRSRKRRISSEHDASRPAPAAVASKIGPRKIAAFAVVAALVAAFLVRYVPVGANLVVLAVSGVTFLGILILLFRTISATPGTRLQTLGRGMIQIGANIGFVALILAFSASPLNLAAAGNNGSCEMTTREGAVWSCEDGRAVDLLTCTGSFSSGARCNAKRAFGACEHEGSRRVHYYVARSGHDEDEAVRQCEFVRGKWASRRTGDDRFIALPKEAR